MAEFPALPLFTDALVADTAHLSDEEFGAYMRLLILEWRTAGCKLPADANWHMRRLGIDSGKYSRLHAPLISEFFQTDGNHVFQKRMMKEFAYLREQSQKQSERAKLRWNKEKGLCRSDAASGNAPHPTPPKVSSEGKPSSDIRRSSAKDSPSPEFLVWWNSYPRTNCSRAEAWKSYKRARTKGVTHEKLTDSLGQYRHFIERTGSPAAHATTWLNNERWDVDYTAAIAEREKHSGSSHAPTAVNKADRTHAAAQQVFADLGLQPR